MSSQSPWQETAGGFCSGRLIVFEARRVGEIRETKIGRCWHSVLSMVRRRSQTPDTTHPLRSNRRNYLTASVRRHKAENLRSVRHVCNQDAFRIEGEGDLVPLRHSRFSRKQEIFGIRVSGHTRFFANQAKGCR